MSSIDTTAEFSLLAASQGSDGQTIIVSFTKPPVAVNPAGLTDALNPINYSISGTSSPTVVSVTALSSFMFSLSLNASVQTGDYTVTVFRLMSGTLGLTTSSVAFKTSVLPKETIEQGAVNDSGLDTLRRWLPPAYRYKPAWEAFLAAIADGDDFVKANAYAAFDQLFMSSAVGSYLIQRASDYGVTYPSQVGMGDELFSKLAISTTASKLVPDALLKILEVFYGEDSTRAHATAQINEPYDIVPGDSLVITFDNSTTVEVHFIASDFSNISQASADEIGAVMTRAFWAAGLKAYAKATVESTGTSVTIYSGALGLFGSVEVVGGMAQNVFQFPTRLPLFTVLPSPAPQWHCERLSQGEFRFTWATNDPGPAPYVINNLSNLQIGDYVLFDFANASTLRGSYTVSDVHFNVGVTGNAQNATWFSITPTAAFPYEVGDTVDITQTAVNELVFYRIARNIVASSINPAFIAQHAGSGVDVVLPATTQAVQRGLTDAAYPNLANSVPVVSTTRANNITAVTTLIAHGLHIGDMVSLEGVAGTTAGRWTITAKVANVLTPDTFTIVDPGNSGEGTGGTVTPMAAPSSGGVAGPFVFDPNAGFAVTDISTTSKESVSAMRGISELTVDSTAGFATSGYLVFGFGTQYEIGPVRYVGIIDATTFLIDRTFVFPQDIPAGFDVTALYQNTPWVPASDSSVPAFYVTDSNSGRVAAQTFIEDSSASGVNVTTRIIYPGDRGIGGQGLPVSGQRITDKVQVWAGNEVDQEVAGAHDGQ